MTFRTLQTSVRNMPCRYEGCILNQKCLVLARDRRKFLSASREVPIWFIISPWSLSLSEAIVGVRRRSRVAWVRLPDSLCCASRAVILGFLCYGGMEKKKGFVKTILTNLNIQCFTIIEYGFIDAAGFLTRIAPTRFLSAISVIVRLVEVNDVGSVL